MVVECSEIGCLEFGLLSIRDLIPSRAQRKLMRPRIRRIQKELGHIEELRSSRELRRQELK